MTDTPIKRTVCVVSGSRADYGYLYWPAKYIQDCPDLELQFIVTGSHCSGLHGNTGKFIEEDGFKIDAAIDIELSGADDAVSVAFSTGIAVQRFAAEFNRLKPDWILVLGDRYEILAVAQAALFCGIPVCHLAGGDTTEGAFDEQIRHAITKMSHLHFPTNDESALRIRQMGEQPDCVIVAGSTSLDWLSRMKLLSRTEFEAATGFSLRDKNILLTFHPSTLDELSATDQIEALLEALGRLSPDIALMFTQSNADPGGAAIFDRIQKFAEGRPNTVVFSTLGQLKYLSAISLVDVVVGNSSSGLYEVPSFGKPTVDIGPRQQGRLAASSVLHCSVNSDHIFATIERALKLDCSATVNPYGDGNASEKIVSTLSAIKNPRTLLQKRFNVL